MILTQRLSYITVAVFFLVPLFFILFIFHRMHRRLIHFHASFLQFNKDNPLGKLMEGMAHEMNNTLNYLQANAEVIVGSSEKIKLTLKELLPTNEEGQRAMKLFEEDFQHFSEGGKHLTHGTERIFSLVQSLKSFATQQHGEW